MWAQLITTRLKDGTEGKVPELMQKLKEIEQPGSGLIRSTAMRDENDPSRLMLLVVFESQEAARARENDPRRQTGLTDVRALMAEMFAGPPEFTDLTVVHETSGE
jgi:quinol monooxygenase YgiN